jgi:hypothetical protein
MSSTSGTHKRGRGNHPNYIDLRDDSPAASPRASASNLGASSLDSQASKVTEKMFMYVQGIDGAYNLGKWFFEICPKELEGTLVLRRLLILKKRKQQVFDGVSARSFGHMCGPVPMLKFLKVNQDSSVGSGLKKAKYPAANDKDEDSEQDEVQEEDEGTEEGQTAIFDKWIQTKMQPWNHFPRPDANMKELGKASWMVNYHHS